MNARRRMRLTWNRWTVALVLIVGALGCAPGRIAPPTGTPVADPAALEAELREASVPDSPRQIHFAWTLDERGSRVRGEGVARVEAPERIRLDLFGSRGDTYLIAALVGTEYRLPSQVAGSIALPSPSLMWSAMGVLEPPPASLLSSATTSNSGAELRYDSSEGQQFVFTFEPGTTGDPRLTRVQRASSGGVIESVTLEWGPDDAVTRARYRDWPAFRELTLDIEAIRDTVPFPVSIWSPDAAPR